jgi:saccharopine dehydrogenase-like NADP-dependent oxidoreductase
MYDVPVDAHQNTRRVARPRALIVGWRGGVGRALMGVLSRHPMGKRIADAHDTLVLLDGAEAPDPVERPGNARCLPSHTVASTHDLVAVIDAHEIDVVVDLAGLGALDCAKACGTRGVDYLCTSLENWPEPEPDRTAAHRRQLLHARNLLPDHRPDLASGSALMCSGMNPGLISALVETGLQRFARRVHTEASVSALDIYAIALTEHDTTTCDDLPSDVFPMTWSPQLCLDELFEPVSMMTVEGEPVELTHAPHEALYRVRCGDRIIEGYMVPHDELVTLGHRFPEVELAFIYRLPPQAHAYLETTRVVDPDDLDVTLLEPAVSGPVRGRDRMGALLCSRRHGELWVGFDTDAEQGRTYGTNATELQVAAGVVAGWRQLGRIHGLHTVEELDSRALLDDAQSILGQVVEHHDPRAPVMPLRSRRARTMPVAAPVAS